jgi:hypothetical protein
MAFLLPITIGGVVFEVLLRRMPNDHKIKKEYLDHNAASIQTLILGNSHTFYGINPKFLTSKSFNAANISQPLYYDYLILRMYESKMTHLSQIVIPIDYFTLFTNLQESGEGWRVKNYNLYFGMNESDDIATHTEILSGKVAINLHRLFLYYVRKDKVTTSDELGWGNPFKHESISSLKESASIALARHKAKDYHLLNENLRILTSIIKIAELRKIKVILVTCPVEKYYYNNADNNQITKTISEVTKLKNKYHLTYINLFKNSSFQDSDFYDADHVNEKGAKKLSTKMDSVLNSKT